MWFNKKDLTINPIIKVDDLYGYVLPHAGTLYTGEIISHTLRFRSTNKIKKIIILYYPASKTPDIIDIEDSSISYYHEYYVPWKSIDYIFNDKTIKYEGYNINDLDTLYINTIKKSLNINDTLIVISSDFSHFLDFDKAIELENKAAHSLMFRELTKSSYINIVDDVKTYRIFYKIIPKNLQLQWIGRSRSVGKKGVGYLSFLLRKNKIPDKNINPISILPDGIFVTAFDKNMNTRECIGNWYDNYNSSNTWSLESETNLISKVIKLAQATSRLTGGKYLEIPISNYTVTYLYNDTKNNFIRGYHGIIHNAFYLPEVFLENTFNNGHWITEYDTQWESGNIFNLDETFNKLNIKAGIKLNNKLNSPNSKKTKKNALENYKLYSSSVIHYKI